MKRVSGRHAGCVFNVLYSTVLSRPTPRRGSRYCGSVSIRNSSRCTPETKVAVVGSRWQVGRYESIRLFKQVVTSSKSGLWDEVTVTQIRSLTSPYLRALWPPSALSCLQSLPRILRILIVTVEDTSRQARTSPRILFVRVRINPFVPSPPHER